MKIFNFLKRIFEENKSIKSEKEKITFSDIRNCIENKAKENEEKEKEILFLIKYKMNLFTKELEEKIDLLNMVDIESKKVEDKIKSITEDGRKKYIESLNIFIKSLKRLEKDNFEEFIGEINKIFLNFNKSSHMSYERATILIGKEMENIQELIKKIYKDLANIFDENKKIIKFFETISNTKLKLDKISDVETEFKKIEETIKLINKKIEGKKEENEEILNEIESIKKSSNYLRNLEKQEKIKSFDGELEKELFNLKRIIDFKSLSGFFHIFEEEMKIVKMHQEDFPAEFKKDNGKNFLRLLNEAKLNKDEINKKINDIQLKIEEIEKNKKEIKEDETQKLYSKITKNSLEVEDLNSEKEKEEKRIERSKLNREEMIKEIKENMKDMDVEVE